MLWFYDIKLDLIDIAVCVTRACVSEAIHSEKHQNVVQFSYKVQPCHLDSQ